MRRAQEGVAPTYVFWTSTIVALMLIVWPAHFPMVDAPNHLARLYILHAPGGSILRQMYDFSFSLIPNLGLDLVYLALEKVVTPEQAIMLCLFTSVTLISTSSFIIQRALFGRMSWSMAFVPIFIFGSVWFMGYINYLLGVGCALAGLALFIRSGGKLSLVHGALLSMIGVTTLICHVAAFGAFAILLGSLECADELSNPRRLVSREFLKKIARLCLVFSPSLILYAVCQKPDYSAGVTFNPVEKLLLPLFSTLGTGTECDYALFLAAVAAFVVFCLCGEFRIWRRGRPALVLFAIVVLALPGSIGTAVDVDSRLMIILVIVALSMSEIRISASEIPPPLPFVTMALLVGLRFGSVLYDESEYDQHVANLKQVAEAIPVGRKVLVVSDTLTRQDCTVANEEFGGHILSRHFGGFLTIDRNDFTPLIFTGKGMQPIQPRGAYAKISSSASVPVTIRILAMADDPSQASRLAAIMAEKRQDNYVLDWRRSFDYMMILHSGCARNPFPRDLREVARGDIFAIYQIGQSDRAPTPREASSASGAADGVRY